MSQVTVLFEAIIEPQNVEPFMGVAGGLRNKLEAVDGFISVENFKSLTEENKFVNISFWKDETSVEKWRNTMEHRQGQKQGHDTIFNGYRLRVGNIIRDYTSDKRTEAPIDSNDYFRK